MRRGLDKRFCMKLLKQSTVVILVLLFACTVNCNKDPLLTDLKTKKLIVVLKGTYESNSPMEWSMPTACAHVDPVTNKCDTYTPEYLAQMQDDSVYECNSTEDTLPNVFMIDLSEIRLWDTRGKSYKFANYRQTFASALSDSDPMFNGTGYPLSNDDVPSKAYTCIALYIRKMLLDGAKSYVARDDGWYPSVVWDVYKEGEYPTFNFNALQIHSYYDDLLISSASINRVYPLIIPINDLLTGGAGMFFNSKFSYTVLEIRMVVKNFIKKYEQKSTTSNAYTVKHFHGLSDWLNDVEKGDSVIGGNVLTVARTYVPELVGRISGTATAGRHVIAIPAGSSILSYTLNVDPYVDHAVTTTPARDESMGTLRGLNPCNLPKKPSYYTGTSINRALEYFLKYENYKYEWNKLVPQGTFVYPDSTELTTYCDSYDTFKEEWNKYAKETGIRSMVLPQLAVYVPSSGSFTIENVMPGSYDVYVANRAPEYGKLYYNHYDTGSGTYVSEFTLLGTVTVGPGSTATVP